MVIAYKERLSSCARKRKEFLFFLFVESVECLAGIIARDDKLSLAKEVARLGKLSKAGVLLLLRDRLGNAWHAESRNTVLFKAGEMSLHSEEDSLSGESSDCEWEACVGHAQSIREKRANRNIFFV